MGTVYTKRMVRNFIILAALFLLIDVFFIADRSKGGWLAGYLLGMGAVVLHLTVTCLVKKFSDKEQAKHDLIPLAVRFFSVCALFVFFLAATKIDEFSFTVSFIISYILHSVNEVIFLNQKLSYKSDR